MTDLDLTLFNSYELAAVRDALATYAHQYRRGRWQPAYRAAAVQHLVSLAPSRTEGVWGDLDWTTKYRLLRKALVGTSPVEEDIALADVVARMTHLVTARVTLDADPNQPL